jgi:hypothetical protein
MANTPIYGWETPDDTDYVYQGAAAARTTANAIDSTVGAQATTIAALPQGTKSYVRDTTANLTTSGAEVAFFTSPSFTPVAGRLYLISYTVGDLSKITSQGDVAVRLRKTNVAGTQLDIGIITGLNIAGTAGTTGGSFTKTMVATSSVLGTTAFVPCVTVQSTTNSLIAQNINYPGAITITDIGAS